MGKNGFSFTLLWGVSTGVLISAFGLFIWGAWFGGPSFAEDAAFVLSAVGMALLFISQKRRQKLDQPPPPVK